MIDEIVSLWHIAPVRWGVYLSAALALAYVVAARLYRWAKADGHVTIGEKIIVAPFVLLVALLSWAVNWTVAAAIWGSWPAFWNETFTKRLQRTLDHPSNYPARAVQLARMLKPWMNRHDPGHLE